jgi:signal transduction histidine kinase/PAS domain-containing protein
VTYEHEVYLPDGTVAWQQWIDHAIVDAQGQVQEFLAVGRDITDRKRMEDALRVSEAFTRAILASLPAGIAVLDQGGTILAVNEAWERFRSADNEGVPAGIGVGVNYLEVCRHAAVLDVYAQQAMDGIQAVLDGTLETFECEYPCPTPTKMRWFAVTVTPLQGCHGAVVSHAEITRQKQTEGEIRERLQFEQLVAKISSRLIYLPASEIHGAIEWALWLVSGFLGADYAAVLEFLPGGLRFLHFGGAGQMPPAYIANDVLPLGDLPWVQAQLVRGKIVSAPQRTGNPAAVRDYARLCRQLGGASVAGIPLVGHGTPPVEVLLFSTRAAHGWSDALLQRVRVVADLLASVLARQRAEEALRRSEAALRAHQTELQALASKLIWAQEDERRRLARELHDDLSQRLAFLAIETGKWGQTDAVAESTDEIRAIHEQLVTLATDVHALSHQLHSTILDDLGLVDALRAECTAVMQREGIMVSFMAVDVPTALPREVMLCFYRILQEGLRNVVKHAQAKRVDVVLRRTRARLELSLQDTGVGFAPEQRREKFGIGLASMAERARLIQGTFDLTSHPGYGTTVRVQWPMAGGNDEPGTCVASR